MTRTLAAAATLFLFVACAFAADVQERSDSFGPFGPLHIYSSSPHPASLTLFISGDGGWNAGVTGMARSLAELDSMVVGIDITHYIRQLDAGREKCVYAAAHLEELSQYVQKKYGFPRYTLPVLVGYSSGATLVYATLAQSPPDTFAGGISMGFCPDLKTSKPLCKGSGTLGGLHDPRRGFIYDAVPALAAKLYVLQGDVDRVCSTTDTKTFLGKVKDAELVEMPKVGHGFSVQRNWMPQFKRAFMEITSSRPTVMTPPYATDELRDLPLVVLPSAGHSNTLAVMVSGDGGWAGIDRQVAESLNKDGIAVVGLNSLHYFWEKKDPDIAGRDLARILAHYGRIWGAKDFLLIGYSTGADTLPFMAHRLPEELKSGVKVIALLGPGKETNFEFHMSDWLLHVEGAHKVVPEVQKLKGMHVLCIYGEDEDDSGCLSLNRTDFDVVEMKGGHHFGGDYKKLARIILDRSR